MIKTEIYFVFVRLISWSFHLLRFFRFRWRRSVVSWCRRSGEPTRPCTCPQRSPPTSICPTWSPSAGFTHSPMSCHSSRLRYPTHFYSIKFYFIALQYKAICVPVLRMRITLMRIRNPLLTLMRVQIRLLSGSGSAFSLRGESESGFCSVMQICDRWSTDSSLLHFEPLRLSCERLRPFKAPFKASTAADFWLWCRSESSFSFWCESIFGFPKLSVSGSATLVGTIVHTILDTVPVRTVQYKIHMNGKGWAYRTCCAFFLEALSWICAVVTIATSACKKCFVTYPSLTPNNLLHPPSVWLWDFLIFFLGLTFYCRRCVPGSKFLLLCRTFARMRTWWLTTPRGTGRRRSSSPAASPPAPAPSPPTSSPLQVPPTTN